MGEAPEASAPVAGPPRTKERVATRDLQRAPVP
jgi:hypothetical protein